MNIPEKTSLDEHMNKVYLAHRSELCGKKTDATFNLPADFKFKKFVREEMDFQNRNIGVQFKPKRFV